MSVTLILGAAVKKASYKWVVMVQERQASGDGPVKELWVTDAEPTAWGLLAKWCIEQHYMLTHKALPTEPGGLSVHDLIDKFGEEHTSWNLSIIRRYCNQINKLWSIEEETVLRVDVHGYASKAAP